MDDGPTREFLHLALTPGIGGVSLRLLLEHFGSAGAILGATAAQIAEVSGFGHKRAGDLARGRDKVDVGAELELAAKGGVRIVPFGDAEYPVALTYLAAPPAVLYVRGRLLPEDNQGFGIVGSRRCSLYGQEQAERFAAGLVGVNFTIVSGLARGIDIRAHSGALKAGGRTIAALGNGLSMVYPPEHKGRAEEIAASGAVISEFPMNAQPTPENFPRRNRIISSLSLGVLVIEAGYRSGALITASRAAEQGKDVFAVPGRIDTPFSAGTHKLIQDGAKLVHSLQDILDEYPDLLLARAEETGQGSLPLGPLLAPQEEAILGVLDGDPLTADEIAGRAELSIAAVAANLTLLELKRLVQSLPGQRYARRKAGAR
ncbi:MAG: DNA-protecting protein DprA [Anaerolineaceae bacterium]|nr:DNA-protecting protein DprA [Anaerolineaceae bacterium]